MVIYQIITFILFSALFFADQEIPKKPLDEWTETTAKITEFNLEKSFQINAPDARFADVVYTFQNGYGTTEFGRFQSKICYDSSCIENLKSKYQVSSNLNVFYKVDGTKVSDDGTETPRIISLTSIANEKNNEKILSYILLAFFFVLINHLFVRSVRYLIRIFYRPGQK